jgi:hypothetical protein
MEPISRRNVLTAAAAGGGLLTAATIASAQSNEPVPQPQRPGHGGTDPGPRNIARERQNPDIRCRRPPIMARYQICGSRSPILICDWSRVAGRVK